jgi:predicted AlkP superfamily phosphohydrolase/phosphomutase
MLYKELDRFLDMRLRLMDSLWKEENWNLMEVIVTGTDRLHHFGWDAYEDDQHPNHGDFLNYYRNVDRFIGEVHEKFVGAADGDADNFFLLSDHGFCGTRHEVYVNKVLADAGYLHMTKPDARGLEDISEKSTAFALDPARLYVHKSGKYPRGSVLEKNVEGIKTELRELFSALKDDNGDPIIRKIFDGNDVYSGPHAHKGPDLCLVPYNGYDLKGRLGADTVVGQRRLQGMHTWDDAFFATTRADLLTEESGFTLLDVPPKILQSLEVD